MKIISANKRNTKEAIALSETVFKSTFLKDNYMKEAGYKPSNIRLLYAEVPETTRTAQCAVPTKTPCRGRAPARPKYKLVSMACVLPRIMNFDGFTMKLAGIGGVATLPEARGKGYAAAIMRDAVSYMEKQGYALSLLYPYKSAFYRQFGYRNITFPFRVIDTASIKKPVCRFEIKRMTEPDYAGLKRVYDAFNKTLTATISRPLGYWKNYCEYWVKQAKQMCWKKDPFFCAYKNGRPVAYIRVSAIRKTWTAKAYCLKISEFAAMPGFEKAFGCILYAARQYAEKLGFKKLYFEEVKGASLKQGRQVTAGEKTEYSNLKQLKMYRICDFDAFMSVLGRAFNKRLKMAGLKASWQKYISIIRHVKNLQPRITITPKSRGTRTLRLDEGRFIELILGLKTVKTGGILGILFPLLKPVYWDFDYL